MARVLHIDFETRSAADIRACGVYRYMEDPTTCVTHAAWRFDEGPVLTALRPLTCPDSIREHIQNGGRVAAHNAVFERLAIKHLLPDWPQVEIDQMDCTMARAAALAIPASLGVAAQVMRSAEQKSDDGHALMLRLSRPRKITADGSIEWWTDPDKLSALAEYCAQDVRTESALDAKLPALSARERRVWELDQRINDRGVALDVPMIKRSLALADYAKRQLDLRMSAVTNGVVTKCSEVAKLAEWINAQGLAVDSLAKDQHATLLGQAAHLPAVREAIELRIASSNTSTSKLKAMLACVCKDGRARGLLAYHGASTGRWAGRLIQPQNLPRVDADREGHIAAVTLEFLASSWSIDRVFKALDAIFPSVLACLSKCLRAMFIAAPGHRLVGGDLSNIEGCVNAWIAGETWKVDAYRAYQESDGPDLYRVAYARSFGGEPAEVKGFQRQIGKVQELALGYQGAIGAFLSMARVYGIDLQDIRRLVQATTPPDEWRVTRALFYSTAPLHRHGLDADTWTALKVVVVSWRAAHPAIVQSWWDLQDAAIEAVSSPSIPVPVLDGRVFYLADRGFLWCLLPSGRALAYCKPHLRETIERKVTLTATGEALDGDTMLPAELADLERKGIVTVQERRRKQVVYEGFSSEKKVWGLQTLYGGKQCENICQAVARDVLVDGMFAAEAAGYPLVLTVHDEMLCEVPDGHGSAQQLRAIMRRVPAWCGGLPLDAKTWEGSRYEK